MIDNVFSGSKGVGFIGLTIGLLTLVVFGILGSAALNGKFNGKTPLSEQLSVADKRIERLKKSIAQSNEKLALASERFKAQESYNTLKQNRDRLNDKREAMIQEAYRLQSELESINSDLAAEATKVRIAAVGEVITELNTKSGDSYKGITISDVSVAGIKISRGGKSKLIPISDLPDELLKRFLFSEEEIAQSDDTYTSSLENAANEAERARATALAEREMGRRDEINKKVVKKISVIEREISVLKKKIESAKVKIDGHEQLARAHESKHRNIRSVSSTQDSAAVKNSTYSLKAKKERAKAFELSQAISKAQAMISQKYAEISDIRASAK